MCRLFQLVLEVVGEDLKGQCPIKLRKKLSRGILSVRAQYASLETIK